MNNFTSLIHGDLGALVADYLTLSSLSVWSRCDRNGHTIVQYKFSHMKRFDLRQHTKISRMHFGHLCERLRGIEILEWSIDDLIFSSTVLQRSTCHVLTDFAPLRSFHRLLLANASQMRVLNQTQGKEGLGQVDEFTTYALVAMREMVHLEVVQLVLGTKSGRPRNLRELSDPEELNRLQQNENGSWLLRPYDFNYPPGSQPGIESEDVIMKQIEEADSILGTVQEEAYEKLHQVHQQQAKLRAQVIAPSSSSYSTLRHFRSAMDVRDITEFFLLMPELTACRLDSFLLSELTDDEGTLSQQQQQPECSIRFTAPNGGPMLTQSFSKSLLSLAIDLQVHQNNHDFPRYSQISLHLPHVRELLFYVQFMSISDISFFCPELIKLDMQSTCLKPEEEQTLPDTPLFVSTPPSIIRSLRHSPKLRHLIFAGINGDLLDLTPMLSEEEKHEMDVKAAALVQPSLFDAFESEERDKHVLRIMYYALSLLPCAPHLCMIDDMKLRLTFTEYLTLFPSIRSISFVPFYTPWLEAGVEWLRPPRSLDFHQPDYSSYRIIEYYRQHLKANVEDLTKVLFVGDEKQATEYINLTDAEIHFDMKASQICLEKRIYTNLRSLFLHGPTRVDSAALTLLFRESRSLGHVSLMQLEGIGNEVFTALPSDYVLPALQTLRIKTPCGASLSQTFNASVLDRLTRLFPSMKHFEWLPLHLAERDSITRPEMTPLLDLLSVESASTHDSMKWPYLRELTLVDIEIFVEPIRSIVQSRMRRGTRVGITADESDRFHISFVHLIRSDPVPDLPNNWQVRSGNRRTSHAQVDASLVTTHFNESSCFHKLCHQHMHFNFPYE